MSSRIPADLLEDYFYYLFCISLEKSKLWILCFDFDLDMSFFTEWVYFWLHKNYYCLLSVSFVCFQATTEIENAVAD